VTPHYLQALYLNTPFRASPRQPTEPNLNQPLDPTQWPHRQTSRPGKLIIMDRYDNATTLNTEEQEDEPFYCSPACAEEDIIWSGSDAEETAEETEAKHLRYEYYARRYMRGYQPVLQSASLRGPLSGWINPWRWVPPPVKQDEWWQPGSEDMLFTRERVMKRAADHGFGYLGPTEALAWCKASAQAEAQRINGEGSVERDSQSEIGNTLIGLDADESPEHPPIKDESTLNSDPTNLYEEQSMVNHHSDTPYTQGPASEAVRGKKRPVDSPWLKGSYVSKRARWDGPTVATPTPHPDMGEKHRRRPQSFPNRSGSNNRTSNERSHLSVSFADMPSAQRQMNMMLNPDTPDVATHDGGQASGTSPQDSTFRKSSLEKNGGTFEEQAGEMDELHDESQESVFTSSSRNRSRRKSQRTSRGFTNTSTLDVELDDLDVITPRQPSSPSILPSGRATQNGTLSSRSNKLPRLLRKTPGEYNSVHSHEVDVGDEYSFITEVAPSSRDLEMFQYRKKRKRMDSEASKPNPNVTGLQVDFHKSPRIAPESEQKVESKHRSDDPGSMAAETADRTKISLLIDSASISEDEAKDRSNQSDESWDFMDAIEQLSPPLLESGLPTENTSSKRSPRMHISPGPTPISQALKSLPKTSSQRSKLSLRSSQSRQSQSLTNPRKNSAGPSAAKRRAGISPDPNDASTQSYNTSPPRSTLDPPSELLAQAKPDDIQRGASSSEENQEVMDDIQKGLSRHCPRFTSPATTKSDNYRGSETGDQNTGRVGSVHEPPLDRRQYPRSSGRNGSSQSPREGDKVTVTYQADEVTGTTIVREPQRVQHTPQTQRIPQGNLSCAENTAVEPESEPNAKRSTTRHASRALKGPSENISGIHVLTSTDSNNAVGEVASIEKPMSGSLGEPCGERNAGSMPANIDLETSWEGCGPQSPWAAENLEPIPMTRQINHDELLNSGASTVNGLCKGDFSSGNGSCSEEQEWDHLERPQTPQNDAITPFKDLMSPTPAPEATESYLEGDGLPNTQLLIDAATNNPWTSNLRNPSLKKSKKRVSFDILQSEEKENSQPDAFDNFDYSTRIPGSPPPPQHDSDEDIFDDGTATIPKFVGHFVAARQFGHILPQNQSSPLNSSPRLSAQAEAFIAADREVSIEQRHSPLSTKSAFRKLKSRRDDIEEGSWLRERSLESLQTSPKLQEKRVGNLMASFDMDDALVDMSEFLEDWSVDAELKKAKGSKQSESSGRRESNGSKRRRLFRLV
jgi:hypothetical protein